ncbi:MAG: RNase adapter RapZ [Coriobacteriia bacterium]|nr:RNase adapter RapZ [Coriobacteriia bacterium]
MTDSCPADIPPSPGASVPAGERPELVVITGMSGAGRSEAMHTFEDLGYFCIDNLPPAFLPQLIDLAKLPGLDVRRMAVVCDVRAHEFFAALSGEIRKLEDRGVDSHVVFLEADDKTLVRRFSQTRRPHPLCEEGGTVLEGIAAERAELDEIRTRADLVIDTTGLRPQELRQVIRGRFSGDPSALMLTVEVMSFGFKYGTPSDADIVMDVRFLPNPYYESELRSLTGLADAVRDFVLEKPATQTFLKRWLPLLDDVMPGYVMEGKHHLTVALGCTGGMHRSVALAEVTAEHLREQGYRVFVSHRDSGRDEEAR